MIPLVIAIGVYGVLLFIQTLRLISEKGRSLKRDRILQIETAKNLELMAENEDLRDALESIRQSVTHRN